MTVRRALGSALLVLLGAMIGIGVDRALIGRRSDPDSGKVAPVEGKEPPIGERMTVAGGSKDRSGSAGRTARPNSIASLEAEQLLRDALERAPSPERSREIEDVCSLISPAEMVEGLRMVDGLLRGEPEYDAMLSALAARWVATDPGAVLYVKDRSSLPEPALRGILGELARTDPEAAKDLLLAFPPTRPSYSLLDRLTCHFAEAWARHDLPAALAWLMELPEGRTKNWANEGVVEPWSRADPRAAAAYFESFPGRNQYMLMHVAGIWASKDLHEAAAWAAGLQPGGSQSGVLSKIISVWARKDPEAAWNFATSVDAGLLAEDRGRALGFIASAWADQDVEKALSWFQDLSPGMVSSDGVEAIWVKLAEDDPRSAAGFLASLPAGIPRSEAVVKLAAMWAHEDIGEALVWLDELRGEEQGQALGEVMETWAESDPQAALSYLRRLPSGETRDGFVERIIRRVALAEPEEASAFLGELSGESSRESAIQTIAWKWSNANPARAAIWAESLPEGKARKDAVGAIASAWAENDFAEVEAWLSNLSGGESRDKAIAVFIDRIASRDPGKASAWAERIEDSSERTIKLESVARAWLEADPAGARQWILGSPLPADMKTQLLESSN
jgi:hypothetical protein